jgi:hypothetical protein
LRWALQVEIGLDGLPINVLSMGDPDDLDDQLTVFYRIDDPVASLTNSEAILAAR